MATKLDKDAFRQAVADNISIAGVLRQLGRAAVGSNYRLVHRWVKKLDLDTSHWKGSAHGTTQQRKLAWSEVLVTNSDRKITARLKRRMIKEGLLVEKCAICGMGPTWQGKPLTLILDHENGVRNDHRIENLRLVCPNCDSQLDTFCGRNRKPAEVPRCTCGRSKGKRSDSCRHCAGSRQATKITWPSNTELRRRVEQGSYSEVARELGVSDNAVRKRLNRPER